jgi:hypothetical protein
VSGVVFSTDLARAAATDRWDGSEMYQMYIGCRLIAAGGRLLEAEDVLVRKDVRIPGESVDSYSTRPRESLKRIPIQSIPLAQTARLVIDAVQPFVSAGRTKVVLSVIVQYFGFLYPFWILEYRRVQSWRFAAGVCRGMRPRITLAGVSLSATERACAVLLYGLATVAGLTMPIRVMSHVFQPARRVAQWIGGWGMAPSRS